MNTTRTTIQWQRWRQLTTTFVRRPKYRVIKTPLYCVSNCFIRSVSRSGSLRRVVSLWASWRKPVEPVSSRARALSFKTAGNHNWMTNLCGCHKTAPPLWVISFNWIEDTLNYICTAVSLNIFKFISAIKIKSLQIEVFIWVQTNSVV